jgi:hypothetical protein
VRWTLVTPDVGLWLAEMQLIETAAKQMRLMINYDKTECMELSNSPTKENYIIINNHNIEKSWNLNS